nr:zinc-finger homeodomain protein 2-like [Ipomoea batatas]
MNYSKSMISFSKTVDEVHKGERRVAVPQGDKGGCIVLLAMEISGGALEGLEGANMNSRSRGGGGGLPVMEPPPLQIMMPAGEYGTFEAFKCAARNFHRKETNTATLVQFGYHHAPPQRPQDMETPSSGVLKNG